MHTKTHRILFSASAVFLCLAAITLFSCATVSPKEVKQEKGYYYGFGSGSSASEAEDRAKRDLISNALSETAKRRGDRKGRIEIDSSAAKAFKLQGLETVAREKAGGSVTVTYRIRESDWIKNEEDRETAVRSEVTLVLTALENASGLALAERMREAGRLLDILSKQGLSRLLTEKGPDSPLMAATIESFCREIAAGLSIMVTPESGFIGKDTVFTAQVRFLDGKPAGVLPLRVEWTVREAEPVFSPAVVGTDGKAVLAYPQGESFRNRGIMLTVSTDFTPFAPDSAVLSGIDDNTRAQVNYQHFDDAAKFFSSEVLVQGGSFIAGALARDKRAAKKEAPRPAETSDFYIDVYPVTNALYGMFIEDTRAKSFPDFWDNPDYNQPDQPVIGVSFEDARRFAAWLSAQLGVVKRLPTEDEWEKAARGGRDAIYPWGDESPADGARANYSGNGRFKATSPVGSFEAGRNAYGLFDMAGNVWQWTSTPSGPGASNKIAKGGSWMDGPADLRISVRRDVDPSKGYVDVGFRLVREASNE